MQNQVLQNAHKKVKMQNFLLSGSANSLLKNKNAERLLRCSWGRPSYDKRQATPIYSWDAKA